jgi:hypothetical protein
VRNVSFEVADLQAAVEVVAAEGYGRVGEIGHDEDTWRMAHVRRPEGLIVSLFERVARPAGAGCVRRPTPSRSTVAAWRAHPSYYPSRAR